MPFNQNEAIDYFFNHKTGLLQLNWFLDRFWTKATKEIIIPRLVTIYYKLVEKGFSEENPKSWGDADGHLYYIPNKNHKVIVFTTQSRDYLFTLTPTTVKEYFPDAAPNKRFGADIETHTIHIRRVWRTYTPKSIYDLKKIKNSINNMLDSVETLEEFADDFSQYPQRPSLELYRKIDFNLDDYHDKPRFYGDIRDAGYILSFNTMFSTDRVDGTNYSHNELAMLTRLNLGVMEYDLEIETPDYPLSHG